MFWPALSLMDFARSIPASVAVPRDQVIKVLKISFPYFALLAALILGNESAKDLANPGMVKTAELK